MPAMSNTNTTYPAPAGPVPAYSGTPAGAGPWPGVVILHEGFGLTRDTVRITDPFAVNGFLPIAPSLFHRGNKIACIVRTFEALRNGEGVAECRHLTWPHFGWCSSGGFQ
jgi:carboxymethylenebutenolidase